MDYPGAIHHVMSGGDRRESLSARAHLGSDNAAAASLRSWTQDASGKNSR
jgi:hypothetical protein